jgi:hypothetical protein
MVPITNATMKQVRAILWATAFSYIVSSTAVYLYAIKTKNEALQIIHYFATLPTIFIFSFVPEIGDRRLGHLLYGFAIVINGLVFYWSSALFLRWMEVYFRVQEKPKEREDC